MRKRKQWAISLVLVFAMLFQLTGTAFAGSVADLLEETTTVAEVAEGSAELEDAEDAAAESSDETAEAPGDSTEFDGADADGGGAEGSLGPGLAEIEEGDSSDLVEGEPGDELEYVAPGVWSDARPYFTDEIRPEVEFSIPFGFFSDPFAGMFGMPSAVADVVPTYAEAYEQLIALKSVFPEGMRWTNFEPYGSKGDWGESYCFQGGVIKGARFGVGCAALVFQFQDNVFGYLPLRVIDNPKRSDFHVGDFVRVNDSHFVLILQITSGGVTVVEGNFNKSVHWGRAISWETLERSANFSVTRYPVGYSEDENRDEIVENGTEGSLSWTLTQGGVLTISGNGAIPNYLNGDRPSWEAAGKIILSVDIEPGVTSVGDNAFFNLKSLLNASLPDTIEGIGINAFNGTSVVGVAIPKSCKNVGNDAFSDCASLTSIDIAEGVENIGERAFRRCVSLGYVDFPSSLRSLGSGAFTSCTELTQVRFMPSSGILKLGDNIFTQCYKLNFVSLPNGITTLQPGLFSQCTVVYYLYIPGTVTSLAEAGAESPFMKTTVNTVYFGGTQAQWDSLMNKIPASSYATKQAFGAATVVVDQRDPFVEDANQPDDMLVCKNGQHFGPIENDICRNCGQNVAGVTPVEPVDPPTEHQHQWSEDWSHDTTHHWHECLVGGYFGCENDQKFGYDEHDFGDWTTIVEATTTENGVKERVCSVCSHHETEEIPKLTNLVVPVDPTPEKHQCEPVEAWTSNSTDHWRECAKPGCPITNNSEKDSFGAHELSNLVIDAPATATTNGSGHKDCIICGYRVNETIPATGIVINPGTTTPTNPGGTTSPSRPTGGGGSTTTQITSTTTKRNPDGSTTTTVTNKTTGVTTETTVKPDGSKVEKTIQKDGSSVLVATQKDGTTVTVSTGTDGWIANEVKLSSAAVNAAEQRGEPVTLPLGAVMVTKNLMTAEPITILSEKGGTVKVEIPVSGLTPGTVVVLVGTDASTNIVKTSVSTKNGVIASLPSGATVQIVDNSKTFTDVSADAWYSDAVAFVSARELFAGTSVTDFSPATPMTRGMLMTVLARFDGASTAGGETWYAKALEWAVAHGVSDGSRPNERVTREQLVTMLWRYMGSPAPSGSLSGYSDAGQISSYAQDAMQWAVENGLINGFGDGRLGPQGEATRAQVATILRNLIINLMQ